MKRIKDLKIGTRLGLGLGSLLLTLAVVVALAAWRFGHVAEAVDRIVTRDWAKARAAATNDSTTRANARRTMELVLTNDAAQAATVRERIAANKATLGEALAQLDGRVDLPEGQALLAAVKTRRAAFDASFTQVDALLQAGVRAAATALPMCETLPASDALQAEVLAFREFQTRRAEAGGRRVADEIGAARREMLLAGVLAGGLGGLAAVWLARTITRPIAQAMGIAETVAAGDLGSLIVVDGRGDGAARQHRAQQRADGAGGQRNGATGQRHRGPRRRGRRPVGRRGAGLPARRRRAGGVTGLRQPCRGARPGVEPSSPSASACGPTAPKQSFRWARADHWFSDSQPGRWPLVLSQF